MYGALYYGPQPQPWMASSSPWAPIPPYEGETIAAQTSMTPFDAGNFVPVRVDNTLPPPAYLTDLSGADGIGDWFKGLVQTVTSTIGNVQPGLKPGDQGDAVKNLQNVLIELAGPNAVGPKGADGRYGERTAGGVIAFQKSKGLGQTGIVDAATATALNQAISLKRAFEVSIPQGPAQPAAPLPKIGLTGGNGGITTTQIVVIALLMGGTLFALSRI